MPTRHAWMLALVAGLAVAGQAAAAAPAPQRSRAAAWAKLPDWSGVWIMIGNTVFDRSTQNAPGAAGSAGVRERPPYTPEWEQRYLKNIAGVANGSFPDPLTFCGIPAGMPRMINQPDGYEWVVTPGMVWQTAENATGLRRIYTDGRRHPADPGHTYTGHSIGHWEGETLVVDTVGMRADAILDRTGAQLSDQRRLTERIRLVDPDTLEDQLTIVDPVALTRPWVVVKQYRRQPPGTYIFDYACAENNRSPVDAEGRTTIRDAAGKPISN